MKSNMPPKPQEDILSDFDEKFQLIDDMEWKRDLHGEVKSYIRSKIQESLEKVKEEMDKRIRGEKPFMWLVGESAEAPLSLYDEFHKIDGYNTAVVTHKKLLDEEMSKLK